METRSAETRAAETRAAESRSAAAELPAGARKARTAAWVRSVPSLACALLLCLGALPAGAQSGDFIKGERKGTPGIRVLDAGYEGGRLSILGFSRRAGFVKIKGTTFTAKASPGKTFTFNLAYRSSDCTVTLVTDTGSLTVPTDNCAPGHMVRGRWSSKESYRPGDVVAFRGSAWIAQKTNTNSRPDQTSKRTKAAADWDVYAAGGERGRRGPRGSAGTTADNYPQAHIEKKTCSGSGEGVFDPGFSEYYCVVACPLGETAITGWQSYASEGDVSEVANPYMVDGDWFDGSFAGKFVMSAPIYFEDVDVHVGIACVPEITPPISPAPRVS